MTPEQRAVYEMRMSNYYDEVLARIGEIPGWEVIELVHEESDDTTVVCLRMADLFNVDVVLAPTGAYAYAWAGGNSVDYDGKTIFVRGEEFAEAVWMAHADLMGRLGSEGLVGVLFALT